MEFMELGPRRYDPEPVVNNQTIAFVKFSFVLRQVPGHHSHGARKIRMQLLDSIMNSLR